MKYGKGIEGECGKILKSYIKKMPESSNHKAEIRIFDGHDQHISHLFSNKWQPINSIHISKDLSMRAWKDLESI